MNKSTGILIGVAGLAVGVVVSGAVAAAAVNNNKSSVLKAYGINQSKLAANTNTASSDQYMAGMDAGSTSSSMSSMTASLNGKTGDDFDKAFISQMIMHHQGAIDMAKLAQQNAKHQEIKNLAGSIVSAQTTEIMQMENWQKDWGYTGANNSSNGSMGHDMSNM